MLKNQYCVKGIKKLIKNGNSITKGKFGMHYLLIAAIDVPKVNRDTDQQIKYVFEREVCNNIDLLLEPYGNEEVNFIDDCFDDFYGCDEKQDKSNINYDDFSRKTIVTVEERKIEQYSCLFDWYEIGGRWPNMFLVPVNCIECIESEDVCICVVNGYKWVMAARKKDIDWKKMKRFYEFIPVGILSESICKVQSNDFYNSNTREMFVNRYRQFIDSLSDDTVLVSIDCHV